MPPSRIGKKRNRQPKRALSPLHFGTSYQDPKGQTAPAKAAKAPKKPVEKVADKKKVPVTKKPASGAKPTGKRGGNPGNNGKSKTRPVSSRLTTTTGASGVVSTHNTPRRQQPTATAAAITAAITGTSQDSGRATNVRISRAGGARSAGTSAAAPEPVRSAGSSSAAPKAARGTTRGAAREAGTSAAASKATRRSSGTRAVAPKTARSTGSGAAVPKAIRGAGTSAAIPKTARSKVNAKKANGPKSAAKPVQKPKKMQIVSTTPPLPKRVPKKPRAFSPGPTSDV